MYKILKEDGTTLGYTEYLHYIKKSESGCFIEATEEDAIGIVFNGTPYNIYGQPNIEEAETVLLQKTDAGTEQREIQDKISNNQLQNDTAIAELSMLISSLATPTTTT